eukprot:7177-Heterococcus_DN1.PRE.1
MSKASAPRKAAPAGDPFYAAKDEVDSKQSTKKSTHIRVAAKVAHVQTSHARYNALIEETTASNSRKILDLNATLTKDLKSAESHLRDLKRTVEYVEKDRSNFSHIDDNELGDRKAFLNSQKRILNAVKADLESGRLQQKLDRDMLGFADRCTGMLQRLPSAAQKDQYRAKQKGDYGAKNADEKENTDFIHDQRANMQMHIARQDQDLEELGTHVDRVGERAAVINEEIRDQGRMLDSLDEDLTDATEKMGFVMGNMAKLLKTKDKFQIWTIAALAVILIVLVFLVIYS